MTHDLTLRPIAHVRCGFSTPSGTPIQAVYAHEHEAVIELDPVYATGLQDLDGFEHLWLITHLHHSPGCELVVTPFRDDRPHGIFATRSPRRPNPIGLSLVRLLRIEGCKLHISGVDVVDGTPILDIKPYVPAFDCRTSSRAGWFDEGRSERTVADDRFA
ncbi:MAG: tRNA (N6-threonylcarbamoyladenosine(37)-N6)-methyltransferase TrmO [Planctomycetota bacterium]